MRHNLFLKLLPPDIVKMKHEMGETIKRINTWSLMFHLSVAVVLICACIICIVTDVKIVAFGLILAGWFMRSLLYFNVRQSYASFQERRNVEYLYFFMLLVPHLSNAIGIKTGLYRILVKLEQRMEEESVLKQGINRLVIQMTNNPGNIEPFIEFAKTCSGSELAEDVAIALFDFQQNSDEQDAIIRLKNKVNRALNKRMETVVDLKLSRFKWYSTRVVMSVFVLVLGILGTSIWAEITKAFTALK